MTDLRRQAPMRRRLVLAATTSIALLAMLPVAYAHNYRANVRPGWLEQGETPGKAGLPAHPPHAGSRGSTLITDDLGLLVVETHAGALVRADDTGTAVATLALSPGASQLVATTKGRVFVADRGAHRVIRVDASRKDALTVERETKIPEPFGLGLSPDASTLYVTSVADQALYAVDTASMKIRWKTPLRAEPRGLAVSSDGREVAVGFLSGGSLALVDVGGKSRRVRWQSLNPRDEIRIERGESWDGEFEEFAVLGEARSRFEVPKSAGRRHARNVFAVAYVGDDLLVAPHQVSTPQLLRRPSRDDTDSYGGASQIPAIDYRLASLSRPEAEAARLTQAKLELHQPRALAYDAARDILYVAGYGDDRVAAIADVSQPMPWVAWALSRQSHEGKNACGPDGLTVRGDTVWMHCSLSRRLVALTPSEFDLDDVEWRKESKGVREGPELAPSLRSELVEEGAELFRRGRSFLVSESGVMACASCHAEGRQDGLSWRLGKSIVQTPMLAGRVEGTAPYKWNGADKNLRASFKHTIGRLGGRPDSFSSRQLAALEAYVVSLEAPTPPSIEDPASVERGKALFEGEMGCSDCHAGVRFADGGQYPLGDHAFDATDTPSLIGIAHSEPYYHDGSAIDLHALLTQKGSIHDMADFSKLDAAARRDLEAFLRSL